MVYHGLSYCLQGLIHAIWSRGSSFLAACHCPSTRSLSAFALCIKRTLMRLHERRWTLQNEACMRPVPSKKNSSVEPQSFNKSSILYSVKPFFAPYSPASFLALGCFSPRKIRYHWCVFHGSKLSWSKGWNKLLESLRLVGSCGSLGESWGSYKGIESVPQNASIYLLCILILEGFFLGESWSIVQSVCEVRVVLIRDM